MHCGQIEIMILVTKKEREVNVLKVCLHFASVHQVPNASFHKCNKCFAHTCLPITRLVICLNEVVKNTKTSDLLSK